MGVMEAAVRRDPITSHLDDASLVQQAQAGDVQAFGRLVLRYQDRVYNTCWRICRSTEDAADLTQEAFLKAYRAIGTFAGKSSFYTWVFRIAVNLALSHRKRAKLRLVTSLDDAPDDESPVAQREADTRSPSPAARAEDGEMHAAVADALGRIDEHHRAVLVLRDIEGFDYHSIAEVLEITVGTVKSRVHRARAALRVELDRAMQGCRAKPSDEDDDDERSRQTG